MSNDETGMPRRSAIPSAERPAPRLPASGARPVQERILAAALALVRAQGLQGLSQARVAAAAGVRQSHLTYYFPTRKDLIKAIVQGIHAGMIQAMSAPFDPGSAAAPSPAQVREFLAQRIREPLMARLMLALAHAADEDPSLRRWLADLDGELVGHLRRLFAELGLRPSEDELALLHASFVGAAILGAQQGTDAAAERAARLARLAFDRLVQGASPARRGRKAGA